MNLLNYDPKALAAFDDVGFSPDAYKRAFNGRTTRLILLGCVASKRDLTPDQRVEARDLFVVVELND